MQSGAAVGDSDGEFVCFALELPGAVLLKALTLLDRCGRSFPTLSHWRWHVLQ